MTQHKAKHLTTGFVLFFLATILMIVAFFGFSRAWFTNKKQSKMTGNVATLGVKITQGESNTPYDTFTFTSSDIASFSNSLKIKLKSTSTIRTLARVRIMANWSTLDNDYESVFDVLNFTLDNRWASFNTNQTINGPKSSNQIIKDGFFYFADGSSLGQISASVNNTPVSIDLITGISLKEGKSMPANLVLNIFAEVEQANSLGLQKFGFSV